MKDEGSKVRCKFCHEAFVSRVNRIRDHFSRITSKDIQPYPKGPAAVYELACTNRCKRV